MALIYLIRHGQDTAAARMPTIGPLSIVSSPLARAQETAAPLAKFWRANQNAYKHGLYTKQAIEERKTLRQLIRDAESLIEEIDR